MENNAVNAVRSTEADNATHDTRFRLNFALYTPHDCGGSGPDADLSFSGTTPEAFDHALATILDVVTDTVYGGQLNGLREIMDRSTAEFMANAAEQEQPEEEAPAAHDDALDVMRYGQDKPQNPALLIETPPLPTKTEPQTPPRSVEHPHGARGLMFLHCPVCNRTFKQFSKDFTESANCFCGTKIPLDNTTRFEYTCPACGKLTYGRTNIETATIDAGSMNCVCGTPCRELRWDPEVRSFHD